jgi:ribosomal protein S18 acetylase RimI-like enzyme
MIDFPTTFNDQLTKLFAPEMEAKGFELWSGLTPEYVPQMLTLADQPTIREYCPEDTSRRFKDRTSAEEWLTRKRGTFLLTHTEAGGLIQLAAYGWSGTKVSSHIAGGEMTFSIRISENYQGQGLASLFSAAIISNTKEIYGAGHVWLETWQSNSAAVHIYHKMGFHDVDQQAAERPTATGGTVADTRLYMTLGNF